MLTKLILFVALALTPITAFAQAVPAGASPPSNIDDRVRVQIRILSERERETAITTGDTDLLLLRRTKQFSVQAALDVLPTSNAFLAPDEHIDDVSVQASSRLRFATRIGGRVDIFAEAGIVGVRYSKQDQLDYNALTGAVGAAMKVGFADLTLSYQPTAVFDGQFKKRQITQHRLRAEAATPISWKGFQIIPSVSSERVLSNPADYENWSYAAEVSVSRPLSRKTPIFMFASAGYERREYDSYFFDFLGVERNDDLARAAIGVAWRPRSGVDVRASYSYAKNASTSDVNGYRAHSGGLGITGILRF